VSENGPLGDGRDPQTGRFVRAGRAGLASPTSPCFLVTKSLHLRSLAL